MRKNKLIYLLLGLVSVCSFSLFAFTSRSNKKTEAVSAVSVNTLYSQSFSGSADLISDTNRLYKVYYDYTISYNRYFDTSVTYGFNVNLNYYYSMVYQGTQYYCRPFADNSSKFNVIIGSVESNEPVSSGSEISLRFKEFYVQYNSINFTWTGYSTFLLYFSNNQIGTSYTGTQSYFYFVDSGGNYGLFNNAVGYSSTNENVSISSFNMVYTVSDYDNGFQDGYDSGYGDGFNNGSTQGYQDGYNQGFTQGKTDLDNQIQDSYQEGYSAGYNEGFNADSTAVTIMTGIFQVALVPVNFFLGMMNFSILGINLATLLQALFTVAMTIIVIKTVAGGNGGKGKE